MLIVLLIALAPVLAAQVAHQQHHAPENAREYARVLEDPSRDAWQKPDEVVAALKLKPPDVIADIGSGTGYFTRRFAAHVAKVFAVDIDPELLETAKRAAPNVVAVLATPSDPKLPPASVDVIFFCNVLHHIGNRSEYYAKLNTALKPGGRIVDVDFYKRETPMGPPLSMKLSEKQVTDELRAAGFRLSRTLDFLPYQYFLEFERQ